MINTVINRNTGKEVRLHDGIGFYDEALGRYLEQDEVLILDKDDKITKEIARLFEPENEHRQIYEIETVTKKVLASRQEN